MERRRQAESSSAEEMTRNDSMNELDKISYPPKQDELEAYTAMDPSLLPKTYKRKPEDRVFVNRTIRMDKIRWFGFDMDYTLAEYLHPQYDTMIYDLAKEQLVEMGYPSTICDLEYEHEFPIRCLFIDTKLGNILKIGKFGEILCCYHGRTDLTKLETLESYPTLQIQSDDIGGRFKPQVTLFSTPECCLYADLIDHFESLEEYKLGEGDSASSADMKCNLEMSYKHLHSDVRAAVDAIHANGSLKHKTLADAKKFVYRDGEKLAGLLKRLKEGGEGAKLFLLTNSEYYYTTALMSYLLDGVYDDYPSWRDYFDVIITSAKKPSFFGEGSTFREVDVETGKLKLGRILTSFETGANACYQGGSLDLFQLLTNANPTEVLYIGDHIFADIVMSKKTVFWRTLLVVPEVSREAKLAEKSKPIIDRMLNLTFMKNEIFRGLDVNSMEDPDISALRQHMKDNANSLDQLYNKYWGSPFRSGDKQTHFSLQVERFADLYTGTLLNLRNYPRNYAFTADVDFLPHEN